MPRRSALPAYIYSKATFLHHYRQIAAAFAPVKATVCYFDQKLRKREHLRRMLAEQGCGFDVTSGGELYRALAAGGDPKKIIYAGVGKTDVEIVEALKAGIAAFNIESEAEIENIDRVAASVGKSAVGALRINPDVDPKTHKYTARTTPGKKETKFGVDIERAEEVFARYRDLKHLRLAGLHLHIGSPVYQIQPYIDAVTKAIELIDRLHRPRGHKIGMARSGRRLCGSDIQSGCRTTRALPITEHAKALLPLLKDKPLSHRPGAGAIHRRQRGHSFDARSVPQDRRTQKVHHHRRRHERSDPPDAL